MSNLDRVSEPTRCGGTAGIATAPVREVFDGREVALGESTMVRRLLPNRGRRLVGPWCFVDHYGPDDIAGGPGMQVPPHPHIGLQTVSWLLDGVVHHRDSLGSDALIRPGELGLMTAGRGISHAEQSPQPHPDLLHGVQFWVALPSGSRDVEPAWDHHADLPIVAEGGAVATVILGSHAGATSPGRAYSPIVGVDVALDGSGDTLVPLEAEFEHAVLVMSGAAVVDGAALGTGAMLYLGCARHDLRLGATGPARVLLLGGAPFDEEIVMWWNFVAHSGDEIADAREQWVAGTTFGRVAGYGDRRLDAPSLTAGRLKPGGAVRRPPP